MRPIRALWLLLVLAATPAAAQRAADAPVPRLTPAAAPGAHAPAAGPAFRLDAMNGTAPRTTPGDVVFDPERLGAAAPPSSFFSAGSLARLAGGAIVGAWVGYFASQVAVSDWANSDTDRRAWSAGGAVIGAVTAKIAFGNGGPMRSDRPAPRPVMPAASGRNVITIEEIQRSRATNAYQLVQGLRNEWLNGRGINSLQEMGRGSVDGRSNVTVIPGEPTILVYFDDSRIGGLESLKEIPLHNVVLVRFLDVRAATLRWGGGHEHGVIQVSTRAEP